MDTEPLQIHIISPWIHRHKAREIYQPFTKPNEKPLPFLLRAIDGTENSHVYTIRQESKQWLTNWLNHLNQFPLPWVDANVYEPNADADYLKTKMCTIIGLPIIVLGCLDLEINLD